MALLTVLDGITSSYSYMETSMHCVSARVWAICTSTSLLNLVMPESTLQLDISIWKLVISNHMSFLVS